MKLSKDTDTESQSRAALIVFQGIDCSGKTTQSKLLVEELNTQGMEAQLVRFPDRTTETGQKINAFLQGKLEVGEVEAHLLFVANHWEKKY